MTSPSNFDLTGALPTGTTLLEASAGTGKTYAIAALAARYLAEGGLDVGSLLLITFGRHATGELRSRVFSRLTDTLAGLDEVLAGRPLPEPADAVTAHLAAGDAALHRARLAAAVARSAMSPIKRGPDGKIHRQRYLGDRRMLPATS